MGDKKINQYIFLDTIGNGAFSKVKKVKTINGDQETFYAAKVVKKHVLIRQRAVRYNSKGEPVMLNNLDKVKSFLRMNMKVYEEINVWQRFESDKLVKLYEVEF